MSAAIDHVLVAVPDLDAAATELLSRHGLASVAGGRHVGRGTANRIVPLGAAYLELVTVVDQQEAAANTFGRWVAATLQEGRSLLGWCVAVDDLDRLAKQLQLEIESGSRRKPDGLELRWRMAGLEVAMREPALPFFIRWETPTHLHPGRADADHRTQPSGIAWVEVGIAEPRLAYWLLGEVLPVRVSGASGLLQAVALAAAAGDEVVLRSL